MINWKRIVKNIPTHIQISRTGIYEILWCKQFENENTLGETRFDRKQIVLKEGQSPKETVSTLLHEVYHAASEEYEIGLTENQVIALEKGVYYLIKFLKELLK